MERITLGVTQTISLTRELNVNSGSHVLYFYSEQQSYIDNAAFFIKAGIELNQHIIFIDSSEHYHEVQARLKELGLIENQLHNHLRYINNFDFYRIYDDFHFDRVLNNLSEAVEPHLRNNQDVRLWGLVDWRQQDGIRDKLHNYECECDVTVAQLGFLTVCCYDANKVPAAIQQQMMKTHEYLMTDNELIISNLYRKNPKSRWGTAFPTLSAQSKLESEMDLYKQKLDFVHVVSHEVRNPLTVIKAYASLVYNRLEKYPEERSKLKAISDYVDIIDNEITHIIMTEQMLSSEALWRRSLVSPAKLLPEVLDIMEIKGRTQSIILHTDVKLNGTEMVLCNAVGFKLVLSNLVSNAIKYSHDGGAVAITINVSGGYLEIIVEDKGVGMTDEQLQKLFQKYGKMNEEQPGQGIGLFMVRKLVDHFEGHIEVRSQLNKGTWIKVQLPLQ